MEYTLINLVFLSVIGAGLFMWPLHARWQRIAFTLGVLTLLTAVFDSVIIGLEIVAYDSSKMLGIIIGKAPIEDFAYALAAAFLLPLLWEYSYKFNNRGPRP